MGQIFITSDHHFNHKNIIQYENRPFSNVEQMNIELIKLWNDVVSKHDVVYHLGDFSFGSPGDFLKQLNGKVFLILGNHDKRIHKKLNYWYGQGFDKVYDRPIIIDNLILSHEPIVDYNFSFINVHGHIHSNKMEINNTNNKYINVSVEVTNYKPIPLNKLLTQH